MEDIVGDYKDKTVTLEDFPFFQQGVKMASVHPCRHASVMKVLLDRAEGALRRRKEKMRSGLLKAGETGAGLEGLVDSTKNLSLDKGKSKAKKETGEDEWEVVSDEGEKESDEVAIRVDQYLVVFLKVGLVRMMIWWCNLTRSSSSRVLRQRSSTTSLWVSKRRKLRLIETRRYNGEVWRIHGTGINWGQQTSFQGYNMRRSERTTT